jgi:hypothetical protein
MERGRIDPAIGLAAVGDNGLRVVVPGLGSVFVCVVHALIIKHLLFIVKNILKISGVVPANGAVCVPQIQPDGEDIADASGFEGGKK